MANSRSDSRWKLAARCVMVLACAALHATALAAPTTAPATQKSQALEDDNKFLRFVDDGHGGGKLEASVVTYANAKNQTVDLIAAVHIADGAFYKALDDSFTQYDALLYELVKPKEMNFGPTSGPNAPKPTTVVVATSRPAHAPSRAMGWVGTFQRFLRDELKLTFQLEQINYKRANFVHADLDVETFQALQDERGESMFSMMLQEMIRGMAGEQPKMTGPQPGILDLIRAMQSPDSSYQLKLILARTFGQIDAAMAGFGDPDTSVIIGERNKAALKVLKQRLDAGDQKIGIFYGAGHLKTMEHTMETQMGFHQVGQPKWRTAWDVTAASTQPATPKAQK